MVKGNEQVSCAPCRAARQVVRRPYRLPLCPDEYGASSSLPEGSVPSAPCVGLLPRRQKGTWAQAGSPLAAVGWAGEASSVPAPWWM